MAKDLYIQALRGLAIAAVVLIHCLPQCEASVALRTLLNWSVAMFLFLSGVLTTEEKMKRGGGNSSAITEDRRTLPRLECDLPAGCTTRDRPRRLQGIAHRRCVRSDVLLARLRAAGGAHASAVSAASIV